MSYRKKFYTLFSDTVVEEQIDSDSCTIRTLYNDVPFRVTYYGKNSFEECYQRLIYNIREYLAEPEVLEYRNAYLSCWMDNVINGVGDKNGETIPSQKQVNEYIRNNQPSV